MEVFKISMKFKIILYILYIYPLYSIDKSTGEIYIENINHTFPKSMNLLNNKILMINNDGIYLYSSELTDETLKLNISSTYDEVVKAELKQFSQENEGYIIIILQEKLFFFTSEGNYYHDFNLPINSTFYSLVPYKKSNEYLHYIIGGQNETDSKFNLYYYEFNLNEKINKEIFTNIIDANAKYSSDYIYAASCVLMFHGIINKNILMCLYSIFISQVANFVKSSSFDLDNNLKELTEYDSSLRLNGKACQLI